MRKKNGFTLIELLAVIVILTIVALISTPVILNVIEKAKKSSFMRSIDNVVEAGNLFYFERKIDAINGDIRFECTNKKCISSRLDNFGEPLKLQLKGNTGEGYVIVANDGNIEFMLEDAGYCAYKKRNAEEVTYQHKKCEEVINDETKPIIEDISINKTDNSIKVVVNAYDNESGIKNYKYTLTGKKEEEKEINNSTYTFDELISGTYTIKVRVTNNVNLYTEVEKELIIEETKICPVPIIDISNEDEWTQSKEVTFDYGDVVGCIGKYSLDGINFIEGTSVTIDENITVYAINEGAEQTASNQKKITKIDNEGPTLTIGEVTSTNKTIKIEITSNEDTYSSPVTTTCVAGENTSNYDKVGIIRNGVCTISGLNASTIYHYKLTSKDKLNNYAIDVTGNVATQDPQPFYIEPLTVKNNPIYYNPTEGKECTLTDYENNLLKAKGSTTALPTGLKTGCMKWYAYKDNDDGTLDMILAHNTTAKVAYNSSNSNSKQKEVATALASDTSKWKVKARLITAQEIANIARSDSWASDGNWFYLQTKGQEGYSASNGTNSYSWLFDYTHNCESRGCSVADNATYGYWTSTPHTINTTNVWDVRSGGDFTSNFASNTSFGVRPVITVSKFK